MAKESRSNIFRRLTKLFRSGPVIKRKVKNFDANANDMSSAFEVFRKNQSQAYSAAMSAYGAYDRMARYSDFSEMEYTPEIAGALDIYAEEAVSADEHGKVLHITSENSQIKTLLEEMFYDTLNIEFNLTSWARNLVKYGDFFLFNDVSPKHGIINAFPLPISELEREEGFDPKDPMAVRFRWVTQGNQVLENWQVSHMRLLGNDAFLPYGSSILEPARRIWRQMILLEDAMMVFRVVRAPARRIFYIDVGNVPPEEIPNYMEQAQSALKRSSIVDRTTGRVDLRYNPLSIDEDYFIPRRGTDTGTEITELAGQTTAGDIDDVEYIQKKLFAALKVPKAYLGYEEGLGSKATLSQQDIRFARSVARIQRTILAELNKLAIIHLYCNGYTGEDLLDFNLHLSTSSTIAQLQKLELLSSRFTAAQTAQGLANLVDRRWIQKNVLRLSDEEIEHINRGLTRDKVSDLELDATQLDLETEGNEGIGIDTEMDFGDEMGAPDLASEEPAGDLAGGGEDSPDIEEPLAELNITDEDAPVKVANRIDFIAKLLSEDGVEEVKEKQNIAKQKTKEKIRKQQRKEVTATDQIDIAGENKSKKDDITGLNRHMSDLKQDWKKYRFDEYLNRDETFLDEYLDNKMVYTAQMTNRIETTLKSLDDHINSKPHVISENNSKEEEDNDKT
jgi:hypothetical protein